MNEYLAHYGVIGMKWGVRKSRGGYSARGVHKGKQSRGHANSVNVKVKNAVDTVKTTTSNAVNYVKTNHNKIIGVGIGAVTFAAVSTSPALAAGISAYNASQLFLKNTRINELYTPKDNDKTSKTK